MVYDYGGLCVLHFICRIYSAEWEGVMEGVRRMGTVGLISISFNDRISICVSLLP